MKKAIVWEEEEGIEKLRKYCAWQERCRSEAWTKLSLIGCPRADIERLLDQLVHEGFLDEARYARAYARGHFSQKGWGMIKIREALRGKRVPEELIAEALELIAKEAYYERLKEIVRKKIGHTDVIDWETGQKVRRFLENKGYEWELIERVLKDFALGEE